jgi:predicted membrane protein
MRGATFILGLLVAACVIAYPRFIAADMHSVPHGWLVLLLLGMSCCFVYGIGFKPKNRLLRTLFSAAVAWFLVLLAGAVLLLKGPLGSAFHL